MENKLPRTKHCFMPCSAQQIILQQRAEEKSDIRCSRFSLTESQTQKYIKWRLSLPKKADSKYEFIFTPSAIENVLVKRDDGYELDLTE